MSYGWYAFGASAGGFLFSIVTPAKTISYAAVGSQAVGKSTLHSSIYHRLQPIHQSRLPTVQPGVRTKTKLPLPESNRRPTRWERRDYPHDANLIESQIMELKPAIIWWIVDVDTWRDEYNFVILDELVRVLKSNIYQKKTTSVLNKIKISHPSSWKFWEPWVQRHLKQSNKCKQIIMALNKIDKWDSLPTQNRTQKIREVLNFYFTRRPHEMDYLSREFEFHFLPTSFENGNYISLSEIDRTRPLEKWFTWLVDSVVLA